MTVPSPGSSHHYIARLKTLYRRTRAEHAFGDVKLCVLVRCTCAGSGTQRKTWHTRKRPTGDGRLCVMGRVWRGGEPAACVRVLVNVGRRLCTTLYITLGASLTPRRLRLRADAEGGWGAFGPFERVGVVNAIGSYLFICSIFGSPRMRRPTTNHCQQMFHIARFSIDSDLHLSMCISSCN